jgi:hypothetical protein
MRAIKVLTGVWLFCLLLSYILFRFAHGASLPHSFDQYAPLSYLITLPVLVIVLVGIPVMPILWIVAFFLWLTKPSKPDFTPREIASREKPVVTHDTGHRWLG